MLIKRLAVNESVLELAAGRVGCLNQYENTPVLCIADIDKRFYAIGSQIRIYGKEIRVECGSDAVSNLYPAQMRGCVCCGSGTDITALCVADHYKALLLAVFHSLVIHL